MVNKIKQTILLFVLTIPFIAKAKEDEKGINNGDIVTNPNLEINPNANFTDTAAVLFQAISIISIIAAFGVLVWAGFLHITSMGDPGKIADARKKAIAAISGLIFIFSSYLILNTINPDYVKPTMDELANDSGMIILTNTETKKQALIVDSVEIIGDRMDYKENEDGSFDKIKGPYKIEFQNIEEGKLAGIYIFDETSFQGDSKFYKTGAAISLTKFPGSIKFLWNKPGVYLYEADKNKPPLYLTKSDNNIGKYVNKIEKIKIIEDESKDYAAVLFSDTNYYGYYAIINQAESETDISKLNVGIHGLESIFIYHPTQGGSATFYSQSNKLGAACNIDSSNGKIQEKCKIKNNDDEEIPFNISSFKIDPGTAIILDLSNEGDQYDPSQNIVGAKGKGELFTSKENNIFEVNDIKTTQIYTEADICNPSEYAWLWAIPGVNSLKGIECVLGLIYPQIFLPQSFIKISFE